MAGPRLGSRDDLGTRVRRFDARFPYPHVMDQTLVGSLRAAAAGALPAEPVSFVYLFGSRATGRAGARSDTDIAVLPRRDLTPALRTRLRNRIAEIVEPVTRTEVDVVLLDEAPLALRGRILRQRIVLFSADEPLRVRWESLVGRMYDDAGLKLALLDHDLLVATATGRR